METMSVHRALAELKNYNKRINTCFCFLYYGKRRYPSYEKYRTSKYNI